MTEGATAIYVSLATALAVWATIAIYLGRVGARLRAVRQELERMPPGDPPMPHPPAEPEAMEAATTTADHPARLLAWLMATGCGCGDVVHLLHPVERFVDAPHSR
ncbi:MAG: hypothetical protein OHK0015_07750 [Chloroflexi bacterium OHK40]